MVLAPFSGPRYAVLGLCSITLSGLLPLPLLLPALDNTGSLALSWIRLPKADKAGEICPRLRPSEVILPDLTNDCVNDKAALPFVPVERAAENPDGCEELEPYKSSLRADAAADPVDRRGEEGPICERMEWREPCSDMKSIPATYTG